MQRRPFRDELRDAFEAMSEPAHPALASRIHEEIWSRPAPGARIPRLAAVLAVLVAVIVVVGLVLIGRHAIPGTTVPAGQGAPPSGAVTAQPTPPVGSPASGTSPSGATSPAPSAAANLPGFSCAAQSGGTAPAAGGTGPVPVTGVRTGAQSGFDRFVIEFNGSVPQYEVKPQTSARFVQDPSGLSATLDGLAGLRVTVHNAQSHGSYSGATDQRPALNELREARQLGDFEGVVTWGLGLTKTSCFRAYVLTGPSRLVIDVQQ